MDIAPLGISHVAVGVSDMDRALAFYTGILGLSVSLSTVEQLSDKQTSGPQRRRRAAYLRWDHDESSGFLVLDERLDHDGDIGRVANVGELGFNHIGFWVTDMDTVLSRARAAGVIVMGEPLTVDSAAYGEPPGRSVTAVLMKDPDGNVVQIDQRVPSGPAPTAG
jgi:catechol 2,3-dioxygenase-like lactoylglutathione lyase family enzyme